MKLQLPDAWCSAVSCLKDQTPNTPKGTSEPTGECAPRVDVELLVEECCLTFL